MTEIIDRADVALILADPRFQVPEADAAATPFERFRADASRFSNGAVHVARRRRLESMLAGIELAALTRTAASLTRSALEAEPASPVATIARHVPVTALGLQLGFRHAESLPPLVAAIADAYASGRATDAAAADAATVRLLDAAPGADASDDVLLLQLLVQAYAATGTLVERAMQRLAASDPRSPSTHEVLTATLRDDSPVPMTRRVAPDHAAGASTPDVQPGALLVLRLDGPDRDAAGDRPPRTLAFGAGHRGCPAPHHALAIAVAIIEELRRAEARARIDGTTTKETIDVDAR